MKVGTAAVRTIVALAVVAGGLALASPASAATLTVCPSGCSYTSIAAAVAVATPGDTVDVGAGTYVENGISLTKAITIRGAGRGQTIVDGGGLDTSPRVGIFQIRPAATATSGVGTITVKDMTVRNPSKQGSFYMNFSIGVKQAATGVTDITLDNLAIEGTNDAAKWNYGIYADGGNPIAGAERKAPALVVKNSSFTKTAFNNLGVDAWVGDVSITNNDFTESVSSGSSGIILLNEYTATQIPNPVVVTGNRSVGRLFYLSNIPVPDKPGWADVTVSDNAITGLGANDPGIFVGSNTALTAAQYRNGKIQVAENEISADAPAPGSTGVVLGGMIDEATVVKNTIRGTESGVSVRVIKGSSPTSTTVRENDMVGSGTASSVGVAADSDPLHLDVLSNDFTGFSTGVKVGGTAGRHAGKVTVTSNKLHADGYTADTAGVSLTGLVDDTQIEANDITGWDDAIRVAPSGDDQPGPVEVLHNRVFADAAGLRNTSTTQVDAAGNWWGCQTSPTIASNTYCSTVFGDANVTPWLAVTALPQAELDDDGTVHVGPGDEVLVDVSFVSTNGTASEPVAGLPTIFDNLPAGYETDAGSFTGPSTLNGAYAAEATFVAPEVAGVVEARVVIDEELYSAPSARTLGSPRVTGEPVPVRFTVETGSVLPPVVDVPGDGGPGDGGPGGVGVLPAVGVGYPVWLPWLALTLLLCGGALVTGTLVAPRSGGAHRR